MPHFIYYYTSQWLCETSFHKFNSKTYNSINEPQITKHCIFFLVRGSTGISLNYGPPGYDLVVAFTRDESKYCKTMIFSPDGKYFAWINGFV